MIEIESYNKTIVIQIIFIEYDIRRNPTVIE